MSGEPDNHPLKPKKPLTSGKSAQKQELTISDVTNQSRQLMVHFIHDRMVADGFTHPLANGELIAAGTPTGPPVDHIQEVASALRQIGDELDGDAHLQRLIADIPADATRQTFMRVSKQMLEDGDLNWGRVTMLFYFAYKMICKAITAALDKIPFLRGIVECVVDIINAYVSPWILQRGGWESVFEYFDQRQNLTRNMMAAGFVLITAFFLVRYFTRKT